MPFPGDVTFSLKRGEYKPAAIEEIDNDQPLSPFKPDLILFNQADATTIRNREFQNLNEEYPSSVHNATRRKNDRNRRICILLVVICLIIFFFVILPVSVTYGNQTSAKLEASVPGSGTILGRFFFVVSSNNTDYNSTFETYVRTTNDGTNTSGVDEFHRSITDMIKNAFAIYSTLCTVNLCNSVTIPTVALNGNHVVATFVIDMTASNDTGSKFNLDRSMIDEAVESLKVFFPETYPYAIQHTDTTTNFDSFCSQPNAYCAKKLVPIGVIVSSNGTIEEIEWRGSTESPIAVDLSHL